MHEDLFERLWEAANDSRHQQLLREAAVALKAARENAERYRAMRDEFLWSMVSNTERTDLTLYMPGVSLAAINPNSDEFDAVIDAARAATSAEGMGEAASD